MRRGPVRHMFVEDPENTDPLDRRQWCARCNLPAANAIHNLPKPSNNPKETERDAADRRR